MVHKLKVEYYHEIHDECMKTSDHSVMYVYNLPYAHIYLWLSLLKISYFPMQRKSEKSKQFGVTNQQQYLSSSNKDMASLYNHLSHIHYLYIFFVSKLRRTNISTAYLKSKAVSISKESFILIMTITRANDPF